MADFTDKYGLEKLDYGVEGWSAIVTANMEKIDDYMNCCVKGTAGQALSAGDAVYLSKSTGKFHQARATSGNYMPCQGICREAAAYNQPCMIQIIGVFELATWSWSNTGYGLWVSSSTAGGLVTTPPGSYIQLIGTVFSSTKIIIHPGLCSWQY